VAALLYRGIRLVHVPTTMVSIYDSVVSLKQAVNGRSGKNVFGTFWPPAMVLADFSLLQTLPAKQRRAGVCGGARSDLGVRPAMIPALRQWLNAGCRIETDSLAWLLEESIAAKVQLMAHDAFEKRAGLCLEYGHTVGHAVELADAAVRGAEGLSHGEAVGV